MKAIIVLLCLFSSATSWTQEKVKNKLWFVFLVRGSQPRPSDEDALMKMQAAHLENFGRRYREGKLIAAGPVRDPGERRRGIVVLTVPTSHDVRKAFEGDPFVENRIMNLEFHEWTANPAGINRRLVDPNDIQEYRLVVGRRRDAGSKKRVPEGTAYWSSATGPQPGMAGYLLGASRGDYLMLFPTKDDQSLRLALTKSPAGMDPTVEFQVIPLWMAKGTLSNEK